MAIKSKKAQAKPKKGSAKKPSTAKKVSTIAKKKVVKPTKASPKKVAATKKTAVKKSIPKKAAAKKPAAKAISPKKSKVTTKKATIKKTATAKKTVLTRKKAEVTAKASAQKPLTKKPSLKIVVSNKEKMQLAKTGVTTKTAEKFKASATIESIEKGVKRRIMESLEVKPIKPSTAGLFGVPPYHEKPDEEYMNEAQKNHFREILRRWKKELMEEVDRTKSHMQQDGATRHPDPSDNATQEEEFSLELRTRDRERKLIKKIDESLERIDQDDYGYCDACGIEIGIRRLEARPTAEMCIDCKTLDEIKERQTRG